MRTWRKSVAFGGVIVSLVEPSTARRWAHWEPGLEQDGSDGRNTTPALRRVIRDCRRHGWKIRVVSTPVTITRDLEGSRSQPAARRTAQTGGTQLNLPEPMMLGQIGALDVYWKEPQE